MDIQKIFRIFAANIKDMEILKHNYSNTIHFTIMDEINGFEDEVTNIYVAHTQRPPKWIVDVLNAEPQKQFFYVHSFGTYRRLRNRGYGRKMLQYIKEYYAGCVLFLEVGSCGEMTNEQLKAFYESEGFREILPKEGYVAHYTMAIEL